MIINEEDRIIQQFNKFYFIWKKNKKKITIFCYLLKADDKDVLSTVCFCLKQNDIKIHNEFCKFKAYLCNNINTHLIIYDDMIHIQSQK